MQWMPLEDYEALEFVQSHELMNITKIYKAKIDGLYTGFCPVLTESGFSEAKGNLYLNEKAMKSVVQGAFQNNKYMSN